MSRLSCGDESVPQKHQFHLGIFTGLPVENKIWVSAKKKNLNFIRNLENSQVNPINTSQSAV